MITGIHHASFTVSQMKRSVAFYSDLLGMNVLWDSVQAGAPFKGPVADKLTNCPGTELHIVFLQVQNDLIELIEYTPSGRILKDNQASDTGAAHICFKTDDIQSLYKKLAENGVKLHCEPQSLGGVEAIYFRDPDGIIVEAMQGDPLA